jgi:hypothetical protein
MAHDLDRVIAGGGPVGDLELDLGVRVSVFESRVRRSRRYPGRQVDEPEPHVLVEVRAPLDPDRDFFRVPLLHRLGGKAQIERVVRLTEHGRLPVTGRRPGAACRFLALVAADESDQCDHQEPDD